MSWQKAFVLDKLGQGCRIQLRKAELGGLSSQAAQKDMYVRSKTYNWSKVTCCHMLNQSQPGEEVFALRKLKVTQRTLLMRSSQLEDGNPKLRDL
jgi:hypothetical protein